MTVPHDWPQECFWDSLEVTLGIKETAATHYSQHVAAFLIAPACH